NVRSLRQIAGHLSFEGRDFAVKISVQVMQVGPDGMVHWSAMDLFADRLFRPGEHFVDGAELVADLVLSQVLTQGVAPKFKHLGGRFTTSGKEQCCRRFEELIE